MVVAFVSNKEVLRRPLQKQTETYDKRVFHESKREICIKTTEADVLQNTKLVLSTNDNRKTTSACDLVGFEKTVLMNRSNQSFSSKFELLHCSCQNTNSTILCTNDFSEIGECLESFKWDCKKYGCNENKCILKCLDSREEIPHNGQKSFFRKRDIIQGVTQKVALHTDNTNASSTINCKRSGNNDSKHRILSPVLKSKRKDSYENGKAAGHGKTRDLLGKRCYVRKWNGSFTTVILFLSIWMVSINCQPNVTWSMKTKPILFGQMAELTCNITGMTGEDNLCQKSFRQWYGGKNHSLICRGGSCRNPDKYLVKKDSKCTFSLLIYNFSETDVNCEYTCSYGNSNHRQSLLLDENHFMYVPDKHEVSVNKMVSNTAGRTEVNIFVNITKVFPFPDCDITYEEENISKFTTFTKAKNGALYSYTFNILYYPERSGFLVIVCRIGETTVIAQNLPVFFSSGKTDNKPGSKSNNIHGNAYYIVVALVVIVLILAAFYAIRKKMKRRKSKTPNSDDIEETETF